VTEFITNTNANNTALFTRARAAALYYQSTAAHHGDRGSNYSVTELAAGHNAIAEAALKDILYGYRYVTITKHPESLTVHHAPALFSSKRRARRRWLISGC
jgi:hypothetical protein